MVVWKGELQAAFWIGLSRLIAYIICNNLKEESKTNAPMLGTEPELPLNTTTAAPTAARTTPCTGQLACTSASGRYPAREMREYTRVGCDSPHNSTTRALCHSGWRLSGQTLNATSLQLCAEPHA